MAFTGTATIVQLSDKKVLITGLSLAASAAGTLSLQAGAGEQKTPSSFDFNPWKYLPASSAAVTRAQGIRVTTVKAAATPVAASSVSIVYSGADTDAAALWTLTNTDAANASGALLIYIDILAG